MMFLMMSLMMGTIDVSLALGMIVDFKKTRVTTAKVLEIIEKKPKADRRDGDAISVVHGRVVFKDV
jgi:hypothetical protein